VPVHVPALQVGVPSAVTQVEPPVVGAPHVTDCSRAALQFSDVLPTQYLPEGVQDELVVHV
jgi:hypothetical protein